jgi:hypothetical protein
MPQPRKFESNADRQEAYRLRKQGHPINSSQDLRKFHAQPGRVTGSITDRVVATANRALASYQES